MTVGMPPRADAQPADLLSREIARVTAGAAVIPTAQREGFTVRVGRARVAVADGRLMLALYELQAAWEMQDAFAFARESGITSAAAFEAHWKALGPPRGAPPDGRARPLLVEGLAQSSEGKASATYHASLPYAQDAGLEAGLYYLGESQAFHRFAAFARSLPIEAGPAPPLRSIAAELTALEADVLDAYDKAQGDARTPFIGISVTLKLARTLEEQQRRPGALLQYLLARYRFGLTRTPDASADALRERLASADTFARDVDHSLAWFFIELARASAASPAPPGPRAAAAILDDVLPAYRAAIR
jgi:hypothetical protein